MNRRRFTQTVGALFLAPMLPGPKIDQFKPLSQEVQVFQDDGLPGRPIQRVGWYGFTTVGFAVLDNKRVLLGEFE